VTAPTGGPLFTPWISAASTGWHWRRRRRGCLSMFVVVAFVSGVAVSVVDVVQMVAVEDGGVAASLTVHVDVLLGRLVHR
jgi:hypothetical protein